MAFWYDDIVETPADPADPTITTRVGKRDAIIVLLSYLPLIAATAFFGLSLLMLFMGIFFPIALLWSLELFLMSLLPASIGLIVFANSVPIGKFELAIRQLFGGYVYFRNCVIFFNYMLGRLYKIPGEQDIIISPNGTTATTYTLKSYMKLDPAEDPTGLGRTEILFEVNFTIVLLISLFPERVARNFLDDFKHYTNDPMLKRIERVLLQRLLSLCDTVLQQHFAKDARDDVIKLNRELKKGLDRVMRDFGVGVKDATIASATGDYFKQIDERAAATTKANTTIKTKQEEARALKEGTEAETLAATAATKFRATSRAEIALANATARKKELEADADVAGTQHTTLLAQVLVAQEQAKLELQSAIERLNVMKKGDVASVLTNLLFVTNPAEARDLAEQIKDLIKVPETLTLLGGLDINALVEKFIGLLSTMSATTVPAAAAPALLPSAASPTTVAAPVAPATTTPPPAAAPTTP